MAVTMMITPASAFLPDGTLRPNVRVVRDYHGAEEGVRHGTWCPHHNRYHTERAQVPDVPNYRAECVAVRYEDDPEREGYKRPIYYRPATGEVIECPDRETSFDGPCRYVEPLYMATTYAGCVLETRERNGYDDSDFYAIVWDDEKGTMTTVEYATTRFWTYPNGAQVDATDEVRAKVAAYLHKVARERWAAANVAQAKAPEHGKAVRLVRNTRNKGISYEKGAEGQVVWSGMGARFSRWDVPEPRVGVVLRDGRRFYTAAKNVEVLGWEQYLRPDEDGEATARAHEQNYVLPFAVPGMAYL